MKILIAGYYGFGNAGDELILSALIAQFRHRYGSPEITVLSSDPAQTSREHRIRSISRWNPFVVASRLWKSDVFVVGGGGLLQNQTSQGSLLYYLGLIALSRLLWTPVVLYALGVERLDGTFSRMLVKWLLHAKEVKITVRDPASKDLLASFGIPQQAIHVTADPVLSFAGDTGSTGQRARLSATALLIPRFPCPPSGRRMFAQIARILKHERQMKVRGILFHPKMEMASLEYFEGESILSRSEIIEGLAPEEIPLAVGEFDWVISSRFHGLVLAALAGRSFIGVGDAHKVGRFCGELGMPFLPWTASESEIRNVIEQALLKNPPISREAVNRLREAAFRTAGFVR